MNVKYAIPEAFATPETKKKMARGGYNFVKYDIDGDSLRVWILTQLAPVEAAIKSGELKGTVVPGEEMQPTAVHLTDTSENLLRFLSATNHSDVFVPFLYCRRVTTVPPKPK